MKQPTHDGKWWKCIICGEYLPEAPSTQSGAGIVQCKCDALYEFNYWMLNRWTGDTGNTGLEPRLKATPKGQVNVRMSRATRDKLDTLTARYGTQAEAVAVAVDRLHQEEATMSYIRMEIDTDPVAFFGEESPEDHHIDAVASIKEFIKKLEERLTELYPGHDVEVLPGGQTLATVMTDGQQGDPDPAYEAKEQLWFDWEKWQVIEK